MSEHSGVETELKIPVPDLAQVRRRLEAAGAAPQGPVEREHNQMFDSEGGRLAAAGQAVRLRRAGQRWLLTFKGPVSYQGQAKLREELELGVENGEVLAAILARLGLEPSVAYEKERQSWRLGEVVVTLDHTVMGEFVEIEGPLDELERAALALGLDPKRALRQSYLALWEQYRRDHSELALPADMLLPRP